MITDEIYNQALLNIDNIRIMRKVTGMFSSSLSQDDLLECKQIGLWRALRTYRPDGGHKFTTWLYRYVLWECQRLLQRRRKHRGTVPLLDIPSPVHPRQEDIDHIYDCIGKLSIQDRTLIEQRYLLNMTLQQIGSLNRYTPEAARLNVLKATGRLREICLKS